MYIADKDRQHRVKYAFTNTNSRMIRLGRCTKKNLQYVTVPLLEK